MKLFLTSIFLLIVLQSASGQNIKDSIDRNQSEHYTYAYVSIEGKGFGKKLKVDVDLGDTPEQTMAGKEYSEILTNKKSYAAVLNHMADNEYELVESRDNNFSIQGTGGTYGIILIMRKKKSTQ
jgi:hypothetical protein